MTEKDLGFRLRRLREKRGISQQTLAIDLGITQSKVSKIENGTAKINLPYFIQILNYFSLSTIEMIEFFDISKSKDQIQKN